MGCGISNSQRGSRYKHLESTTISDAGLSLPRFQLLMRKNLFVIKEVSISREISLVEENRIKSQ